MKKRYVFVLVSILILAGLLYYSDPKKVFDIFSRSDKYFLFYAFLLSSVGAFLRVIKWKVLLKNVPFFDVLPVQFLGSTISNFTPGKMGEPAKSILMKMKMGIPVSRSLSSIIWERIMDVLVLILFSIFFISRFSSLYFIGILSIPLFSFILIMFITMLYSKKFGLVVFDILKKFPLIGNISDQFVETFYKEKIGGKSLFLSFFATLSVWIIDGLVFYLSFRSIGVELAPIFFIGLISISSLVGIASFLPGGLGSTDAVMVFLLSASMNSSLAVTGVFAARIMTFWYSALLGWLSLVYLSKSLDLKKVFS